METVKRSINIKIDSNIDDAIDTAAKFYFEGKIFVYPTDTIYGFGGNPFNTEIVHRITTIKERDEQKRYVLLIYDISTLLQYVDINAEHHIDFLLSIWPNPVSVVLTLNKKTEDLMGNPTAAFRIPHHRFSLKLLERIRMPLISTSVNRANQEPLNDYGLIRTQFGNDVDAIFYTEQKSLNQASTIIDLSEKEPMLIREGKIPFERLMKKFKK